MSEVPLYLEPVVFDVSRLHDRDGPLRRDHRHRPARGRGAHRNVQRFRGGLAFKARRLLYHSTLGLRVIKKKKKCAHTSGVSESRRHVCLAHGRAPLAYQHFRAAQSAMERSSTVARQGRFPFPEGAKQHGRAPRSGNAASHGPLRRDHRHRPANTNASQGYLAHKKHPPRRTLQ